MHGFMSGGPPEALEHVESALQDAMRTSDYVNQNKEEKN